MDSKTRQKLKAQAHKLKPTVIIGNNGLTHAVLNEIDCALQAHELIKVKVNAESKEERLALTEQLCEYHKADFINLVGHIAIIYRLNPDKA